MKGSTFGRFSATRTANRWMSFTRLRQAKWFTSTMFRRYSNYGRYIVIEHQFGGCPYYSLYAHLSAVRVNIGDQVSQGDPIAVMGHTGEGHRPGAISCSPRIEPPLKCRL